MAILNSIRKKTAILILIIALALFAFVLSDLINTSGFSSEKSVQEIGTVGDKKIDRVQFAQNVENYIQQTQGRATTMQAVKQVWDAKVQELALEEEFEELGIEVGRDQIIAKLSETLAGNPNFSNSEGFFDEAVMTEYLANLKETQPQQFQQWQNYENSVANQVKQEIYFNLIKAGVGATLLEAKENYKLQSDNVSFQVVRIPFDKAEDVEVSTSEIENYIKKNPKQFQQEAQRDIQYVLFEDKPSKKDIEQAKANLENLIEDFKTTEDESAFININSDEPYNATFKFENQLPSDIKHELLSLDIGEVYRLYKTSEAWKATKLVETQKMPDSAKASHILISTQDPNIQRTPEEAKNLADSLLAVIKANPSKMDELAKEFSADTGSAEKGGDLGWNGYGRFVPAFNEAVFNNEPGFKTVVETRFGYHVIHVKEHSEKSTMYKFADLVVKIKPSEETLNEVYRNAGNFLLNAKNGEFTEVAKENNYEVKPVLGVKALDEQIPGLGAQRQIVNWAFNEESSAGDIKQFDIDKGYAVVQLNKIKKEGLQSAQQASAKVTPILEKQKKAKAIISQINSQDLNEIASQFNVSVQTANAVNMQNPLIPGAGDEPKVVGVAFALEKGEISQLVEGKKEFM
ncbi:peptidylprolyl isomerase [Flavobacterium sp. CS20]|uniref:peptidylprolyl isomerase n=1 Tax=Flavobacterium sp. CS20 TaxID=2775246 RepID=UPI001B3A5BFD|nr:peptidylprolyl isomerase [Flavobacterium sp. CS20]QTY26375.1 peptidylprolyl isomerase [Flavobacterium sp. CS20]